MRTDNVVFSDYNSRVEIKIEESKGDHHRFAFLDGDGSKCLHTWLEHRPDRDNEFVFTTVKRRDGKHLRLSESALRLMLIKRAKRANINKNIQPHAWRHRFATSAIEAGIDIPDLQKLLGHTNIQTTMNYVHQSREHLRDKNAAILAHLRSGLGSD